MFDEEEPSAKQADFRIGQKLDDFSVAEISQTIERLKTEIARLEQAKAAKSGHMAAAEALFSKKP